MHPIRNGSPNWCRPVPACFVLLTSRGTHVSKWFNSHLFVKSIQKEFQTKMLMQWQSREICSLLILILPSVKLLLQKGGKDSKRYASVILRSITTCKHYCIKGRLQVILSCLSFNLYLVIYSLFYILSFYLFFSFIQLVLFFSPSCTTSFVLVHVM